MSEINLNETFEETMDESTVITVPIDDTLSNSGEAADAAAVGAALALKADAASVVTIDVNGQEADNQGHIAIDGSDVQMGGTDTRTLKAAITAAEGRTGADILISAETGAPTIQQAIQQVGTANATTIPMSADSSTTVAQKISAMDSVAAANSAAIQGLQGKTAEEILVKNGSAQTVEEALNARVQSVNGVRPDANGNAELTTVPLAENLISELSQSNTDSFILRTSGGETSVDSGSAWLLSVRGDSVHTGYSPESLTMTVTETGEAGHISATLDRDTFVEIVTTSGTTTMVYSDENWLINGLVIDPADYGVTITGEPVSGDSISIVYAVEERGTITPATPTKLTATGWNLYNHTGGYARVVKYSEFYGYGISGSYTALKYSATYTGTKSDITVTSGNFTVPGDGYVWVTGGDSTSTAIWATWSDWTSGYEGSFSAYAESDVDFSSVMTTYFPNGLLKAGSSVDEINLNIGQAISRVERMAYSASNLATAKASGRDYEYDDDYIYLARAEAVVNSLTGVDGGYTANDHGLEWFVGTEIAVTANILYGNNLKNKLERDVLTISAQSLTGAQKSQVLANIQAANDAVVRSKVWTPPSGETLIDYINGNVDRSHLPFSAIKVGTTTSVSDSPFASGTQEFTILVTGSGDRLTVAVEEYGVTTGRVYYRSIWQNAWQTNSSWICPEDKAFITQTYTYTYSNLAAGGYLAVSASDLQITAKTGYTLAGIIGYETGSYNVFAYKVTPTTSGNVLSLRNYSTSAVSSSVDCTVTALWVKSTLL